MRRLWARLWEGFGDLPLSEDRPWFRTIDLPPLDTQRRRAAVSDKTAPRQPGYYVTSHNWVAVADEHDLTPDETFDVLNGLHGVFPDPTVTVQDDPTTTEGEQR